MSANVFISLESSIGVVAADTSDCESEIEWQELHDGCKLLAVEWSPNGRTLAEETEGTRGGGKKICFGCWCFWCCSTIILSVGILSCGIGEDSRSRNLMNSSENVCKWKQSRFKLLKYRRYIKCLVSPPNSFSPHKRALSSLAPHLPYGRPPRLANFAARYFCPRCYTNSIS